MVALSYDPVPTLAAFADQHGIAFPLLSDVGSVVIDRLGLRNRHVAEQQAHFGKPVEAKHDGLPYPGTFVIDARGVVVAKRFEDSHRLRVSADSLLDDLGRLSP